MADLMGNDLTRQSASTLAAAISQGEVSAEEVTKAHLERIAEVDPRVHAFLYVDFISVDIGHLGTCKVVILRDNCRLFMRLYV